MSDLWRETMVAGFRDTIMQIVLVLPKLLALFTFCHWGFWRHGCQDIGRPRAQGHSHSTHFASVGHSQPLSQAGVSTAGVHGGQPDLFWVVFLLFAFMGVDA